eukprot:gene17504-12520_t
MNSLVGKHITEQFYEQLEKEQRPDQIENLLASAFSLNGLDYKKRSIILSNYSRHYAFCKTHAFDFAKTSALLSIMHVLLERDTRLHTDEIDMFRSCDYFEELLLTHSVERSPVSVKVFDELDVPRIFDYVMTNYYQHFKLLRYALGVHSRVFLQQSARNDVEEPSATTFYPLPAGH